MGSITSPSPLLVGNWKMNLGPKEAGEFATSLAPYVERAKKTEVWITPPAISISSVRASLGENSKISIGAQNVHWASSGAFTGETSPAFLSELGCKFALTGHSERRHIFGESLDIVAKRTHGGLTAGLDVILCVGETESERERGITDSVIQKQLEAVFGMLESPTEGELIVAYEPVWAIGTGKVASLNEIEVAHRFIKELVTSSLKKDSVRVLYGGSVNPENFGEIINSALVDGALVGGASIKVEQFAKLIEIGDQSNKG